MISSECVHSPFPRFLMCTEELGLTTQSCLVQFEVTHLCFPLTLKNKVLSKSLSNDIALKEPHNILAAGLLLVVV